MPLRFNGKFKSSVCCTMMLMFLLPALYTPIAQAQSADAFSPVIDLHQVQQGIAGEVQVFTVEIAKADNNVALVEFMFRFAGESEYQKSPMTLLEGTAVYTAYIDTEPSDARAIEYYIQALDSSGNRIVKGFSFEPFVRIMAPAEPAADAYPAVDLVQTETPATSVATETLATAPASEGRTSSKKKWLWGLAGLVVVVAVVSSLGGSSSDDNSTDPLSLEVKSNSRAVFSW